MCFATSYDFTDQCSRRCNFRPVVVAAVAGFVAAFSSALYFYVFSVFDSVYRIFCSLTCSVCV